MSSKSAKGSKKTRRRICFVPGCREAIADDMEFFCPKHIKQLDSITKRKTLA